MYLGIWVVYINDTMVGYKGERRSQRNPWVVRSDKEEWNLVANGERC